MALRNKAIIVLESPTLSFEALDWIHAFNEENEITLSLHEKLRNSLYVVQFDIHVNPHAREDLLTLSPVKALDKYVVFNSYSKDFDACNPVDFSHIVTVYIPKGNPYIFSCIKKVVSKIGVYI